MTQPTERIPPVSPDALSDAQASLLEGGGALTLACVFAQHADLYRAYIPFAEQLFHRSSLPPREKEILILRALELCGDHYASAHHAIIARGYGMADDEIEAARQGGDGLSDFDRALAGASEDLVREQCISDSTWRTLAKRYTTAQLMEVVFLVALYVMMAMATKSFGIALEDDPARALNPDN